MRKPVLLLVALCLAAPLQAGASPFTPSRDQWHASNDGGHWSDGTRVRVDAACLGLPDAEAAACSLDAFRDKPFVVIAFVDTGINPYHHDFRAPEFVHHPSTYIDGYPSAASALTVSLDEADANGYDAAYAQDEASWWGAERNRLYWFPGTRIIGAYSVFAGGSAAERNEHAVLDDHGHGTGVASVAAGRYFGSNPDALIVAVEGLGDAPLRWALSQPWIDIVSNSWGPVGSASVGSVEAARQAVKAGKIIAHSSGNGFTNTNSSSVFRFGLPDPCKCKTPDANVTLLSHWKGPSWIFAVGAASPVNGQAHWWHGTPARVVSFGSKWRAAHGFGVTRDDNRDFGGTSCATPTTAGVLSAVILAARTTLGDTGNGPRPGAAVAVGDPVAGSSWLADGVLTRSETEDIVQRSAMPVPFDPERYAWDYAVRPTTDAYYVYNGYGLVDRDAKARALAVLAGQMSLPDRPDVDAYMAQVRAVQDAIYGPLE